MDWFWQVFILLFVFIPLTLMWIYALIDVFLNPGLPVLARILWLLAIIFIPLFGFLAYFIFRPVQEPPVVVRSTPTIAPSTSAADEVAKADELRNKARSAPRSSSGSRPGLSPTNISPRCAVGLQG